MTFELLIVFIIKAVDFPLAWFSVAFLFYEASAVNKVVRQQSELQTWLNSMECHTFLCNIYRMKLHGCFYVYSLFFFVFLLFVCWKMGPFIHSYNLQFKILNRHINDQWFILVWASNNWCWMFAVSSSFRYALPNIKPLSKRQGNVCLNVTFCDITLYALIIS